MKYLKKYESQRYYEPKIFWEFDSVDFKVHRITSGPNKDKITFRYLDKNNGSYSAKYSCILGCAKTVDSGYDTNEKLRNIKIGGTKFRKVHINSTEAIINLFISEKFDIKELRKEGYIFEMRFFSSMFSHVFSKFMEDADDIGYVIDNLKKCKSAIIESLDKMYEEWKLDNNVNKFNI